jgi:hypothetical protein
MYSFLLIKNNSQMKKCALEISHRLIDNRDSTICEISDAELSNLPKPVKRYVKLALGKNKKRYTLVQFRHGGYVNINLDTNYYRHPSWKYLIAENTVRLDQPAFFWQSMIHLSWEFWRKGWLRSDEEQTELYWTWMGLYPLVHLKNEHIERYALGRYLIQAPWYPTVLISSDFLTWKAINDTSAEATLSMGNTEISGEFNFDKKGRIIRFISDNMTRITKNGTEPGFQMVKYVQYSNEETGYTIPMRIYSFWKSPDGLVGLEDLRLDEIIYH